MTLETSIANHYTTNAVVNYYVKIKNDSRKKTEMADLIAQEQKI